MKLTDTQLILLSKAAKRDDRAVQLPSNIDAIAAEKLVSRLAGAGLIEEIEAIGTLPVWRLLDDSAFALRITEAGLKAIGIDDAIAGGSSQQTNRKSPVKRKADTKPSRPVKTNASSKTAKPKVAAQAKKLAAKASSSRGETKHDQILSLLRRKQGASLEELQKISGWQAHSVRGFLSGTVKTKLKLKLRSSVSKSGERRYTIAG